MSTSEDIKSLHDRYVMPTYAPSLVLVKGKGSTVWDAEGKSYLDFASGVAVTALGHADARMAKAISAQAKKLLHVSNLYYNELQPRLAKFLSDKSLGGKVFFCNSGAEANEALIKLARLWGSAEGKHEVISMKNSFHGRTLATLTATGQEKVKKGFAPLPEGFVHAEYNNLDSVKAVVSEKTAAILVEPMLGEGGVVASTPEFMKGLRTLCDEKKLLLLFDEVQTGIGRTGAWFGYQKTGATPDALSLAKGLGGGFPIGAIVAIPGVSDTFQPGSHATTFGGTPLACAAALAVVEAVEKDGLVENAAKMGEYFSHKLEPFINRYSFVEDERGAGLLRGLVLNVPAKPLENILTQKGMLAIATAERVLRMLPPLNVTKKEINQAVALLDEACTEFKNEQS